MWKKTIANSLHIVNHDLSRFGSLREKTCVILNEIDLEQIRQGEPFRRTLVSIGYEAKRALVHEDLFVLSI